MRPHTTRHPDTMKTPETPVDILRSILSPSDSAQLTDADLQSMLDDLATDTMAIDEESIGCVEQWS